MSGGLKALHPDLVALTAIAHRAGVDRSAFIGAMITLWIDLKADGLSTVSTENLRVRLHNTIGDDPDYVLRLLDNGEFIEKLGTQRAYKVHIPSFITEWGPS